MSKILELADAYAAERQRTNIYSTSCTEARAALAAEVSKLEADRDQLQRDFTYMKQQRELRAENERLSDHMAELRNLHAQRINALEATK